MRTVILVALALFLYQSAFAKSVSKKEPWERAEARLKKAGEPFEMLKLKLKPALMKALGANEFYGYISSSRQIKFYLFIYPNEAAAKKGAEKIWAWHVKVHRREPIRKAKTVIHKEMVLLIGATRKPVAPTVAKKIDKLRKAFK